MGLFDKINRAFLEYEHERNIRKGKEKFASANENEIINTRSNQYSNDGGSSPPSSTTFIIIIVIVLIFAIVCMFVITYSFLICMRCNAGNDKNDNTSLVEMLLLIIMLFLLPGLFHLVYIIYKKSDCNPKKRKELERLI